MYCKTCPFNQTPEVSKHWRLRGLPLDQDGSRIEYCAEALLAIHDQPHTCFEIDENIKKPAENDDRACHGHKLWLAHRKRKKTNSILVKEILAPRTR